MHTTPMTAMALRIDRLSRIFCCSEVIIGAFISFHIHVNNQLNMIIRFCVYRKNGFHVSFLHNAVHILLPNSRVVIPRRRTEVTQTADHCVCGGRSANSVQMFIVCGITYPQWMTEFIFMSLFFVVGLFVQSVCCVFRF